MDTDSYYQQYLHELAEIIDAIYQDIFQAESDPQNPDLLNSLFRHIHSIKGSAGMFGLEALGQFTHHLETLMDHLRGHRMELTEEVIDILVACADHINEMAHSYQSGKPVTADADLMDQVVQLCATADGSKEQRSDAKGDNGACPTCQTELSGLALPPTIVQDLQTAAENGQHLFRIRLGYDSQDLANGYDPMVFLTHLRQQVTIYYADPDGSDQAIPELAGFDPETLYLNPIIYVATDLDANAIRQLSFNPDLIVVDVIDYSIPESRPFVPPELVDEASMKEFIVGSLEMLAMAESAAMDYEQSGSMNSLHEIFRVVHNIKGDAGYIGLKVLVRFAHEFESVLTRLRSGAQLDGNIPDLLLQSIDFMKQFVIQLEKGVEWLHDPPLLDQFQQLREMPAINQRATETGGDKITDRQYQVFIEQLVQFKNILDGQLKAFTIGNMNRGMVVRTLKSLVNTASAGGHTQLKDLAGAALEIAPESSSETLPSILQQICDLIGNLVRPKRIGEILVEEGVISPEDVASGLSRQKRLGEILLEDGRVSPDVIDNALEKQRILKIVQQSDEALTSPEVQVRTLRVDEEKINQLSDLASELLVARNTYEYLLQRLQTSGSMDRDLERALKENLHVVKRLASDIHYRVMALRMVPIGGIFRKFHRTVRDICREYDKLIEMRVEGEEIEIDKKAADILTDPLIHLVRNACDHGIESPQDRTASGKPERGELRLRAYYEGSSVCIRIQDDGRGMDREKILSKARQMEITDIENPEDPRVLELIFMPGLSTLETATQLSGRGVGMDVVKTTVESLGGSIGIRSDKGKGTDIEIKIPMTMGVDTVLLVEAGGKPYAIPLSNLISTHKIPPSAIKWAVDQPVFHYRGDILPLVWLAHLLDKSKVQPNPASTTVDDGTREISLVVVSTRQGRFGLIVDRFHRNMELAIRPIPAQLAGIDTVRGVSILGDGRIILVLNAEALMVNG